MCDLFVLLSVLGLQRRALIQGIPTQAESAATDSEGRKDLFSRLSEDSGWFFYVFLMFLNVINIYYLLICPWCPYSVFIQLVLVWIVCLCFCMFFVLRSFISV